MSETNIRYTSPKDPSKLKEWASVDEAVYDLFFSTCVTHGARYKNSNVTGGVLSTSPSDTVIPGYIGYKQLLGLGLWAGGLEYAKLESGLLAAAANVHAVMNGYVQAIAPKEEVELIQSHLAKLSQKEVDMQTVDRRLTQLLLPSPDGQSYISVTPLESGGVSELFVTRLRTKKDAFFKLVKKDIEKKSITEEQEKSGFFTRFPIRVPHPLGGGIPRNAGYFAQTYSIQSPSLCSFPAKSESVSSAISIAHRKPSSYFYLPKKLIQEYSQFRTKHTTEGQTFPSSLELREQEKKLVGNLARAALRILNSNANSVCAYQSIPKISERLETLGTYARACLDPALRDAEWFELFANDIASRIASCRETETVLGQKALVNAVNLSPHATRTVASWCLLAIINNQGEVR